MIPINDLGQRTWEGGAGIIWRLQRIAAPRASNAFVAACFRVSRAPFQWQERHSLRVGAEDANSFWRDFSLLILAVWFVRNRECDQIVVGQSLEGLFDVSGETAVAKLIQN